MGGTARWKKNNGEVTILISIRSDNNTTPFNINEGLIEITNGKKVEGKEANRLAEFQG